MGRHGVPGPSLRSGSGLLEEKWGLGSAADEQGDVEADFIAPLLAKVATVGLAAPDDHLAAVRASLARAVAR